MPPAARAVKVVVAPVFVNGAGVVRQMAKKGTRDGKWKLIDVNTRTPMQSALAPRAGCDVLEMLYRDKLSLPPLPPAPIRYGLKWAYIKNGIRRHRGHPQFRPSLRRYLSLYSPPICFGLLSAEDPRPFLIDIMPLLRRRVPFSA